MAKKPANEGKHWTGTDVKKLGELAKHNTPTGLIAWELDRSKEAVYAKASDEGISLKPTNKSPYNRRK